MKRVLQCCVLKTLPLSSSQLGQLQKACLVNWLSSVCRLAHTECKISKYTFSCLWIYEKRIFDRICQLSDKLFNYYYYLFYFLAWLTCRRTLYKLGTCQEVLHLPGSVCSLFSFVTFLCSFFILLV